MEQELIANKDFEFNYYKEEFDNQKIESVPAFKNWYEKTYKYISEENEKRSRFEEHMNYNGLLAISFCNKCKCYVICSFNYNYNLVTCQKCGYNFCIGCPRTNDTKFCFKGFFKLLFIRTKYRISGKLAVSDKLNIFCTILCILFTPCYLLLVSSIIALDNISEASFHFSLIFSFLSSLLMAPFVLLFFPFAIALLIPSLFISKYFFKLMAFYTSLLDPLYFRLEIDT